MSTSAETSSAAPRSTTVFTIWMRVVPFMPPIAEYAIITMPSATMDPVRNPELSKPSMKESRFPLPASWTTIRGTSAASAAAQAVMRTARPGARRVSMSPMVNRPALRRGSASRNISRTSESTVLRATTSPS
ncbi:hypothetical protein ACVWXU_005874 [Streptomyces sp. TE33382]